MRYWSLIALLLLPLQAAYAKTDIAPLVEKATLEFLSTGCTKALNTNDKWKCEGVDKITLLASPAIVKAAEQIRALGAQQEVETDRSKSFRKLSAAGPCLAIWFDKHICLSVNAKFDGGEAEVYLHAEKYRMQDKYDARIYKIVTIKDGKSSEITDDSDKVCQKK